MFSPLDIYTIYSSYLDYPALFQQTCITPTSTVYQCNDALICTMTVLPQFQNFIEPSNGASGSLTASCTWVPFPGYSSSSGDLCGSNQANYGCINNNNNDDNAEFNFDCAVSNYNAFCPVGSCSLVSGTINSLYAPDNCANAATNQYSPVQGYSDGFFPFVTPCTAFTDGEQGSHPWYQEPGGSFATVGTYIIIIIHSPSSLACFRVYLSKEYRIIVNL